MIATKINRIKDIEDKFDSPIEGLLYRMHWMQGMKHRDIGSMLNIPRPTITKWFDYFGVPTQSCRRFTDKNITSWYYKTGQLKRKPVYEGPDRRLQRYKGNLNVDFFKTWAPKMAYVLGYFCADGCMYENSGGSKYINFVSIDYELLEKVKQALGSSHRIAPKRQSNPNCKPTFLLQIGSKEIFNDIFKLGLCPKKEFRMTLPEVPTEYFKDFVRGYFDGDGCVSYGLYARKGRKYKTFALMTCFTSCSSDFLNALMKRLQQEGGLIKGVVSQQNRCYRLVYSKNDSKRLFNYMYRGAGVDFCLERKYTKFAKVANGVGT